jgi:hypothetical protein
MPEAEPVDQFAALKAKYREAGGRDVPAEALFFHNTSSDLKALRLAVAEIGKEFTDNVYIGKGASSLHPK